MRSDHANDSDGGGNPGTALRAELGDQENKTIYRNAAEENGSAGTSMFTPPDLHEHQTADDSRRHGPSTVTVWQRRAGGSGVPW